MTKKKTKSSAVSDDVLSTGTPFEIHSKGIRLDWNQLMEDTAAARDEMLPEAWTDEEKQGCTEAIIEILAQGMTGQALKYDPPLEGYLSLQEMMTDRNQRLDELGTTILTLANVFHTDPVPHLAGSVSQHLLRELGSAGLTMDDFRAILDVLAKVAKSPRGTDPETRPAGGAKGPMGRAYVEAGARLSQSMRGWRPPGYKPRARFIVACMEAIEKENYSGDRRDAAVKNIAGAIRNAEGNSR